MFLSEPTINNDQRLLENQTLTVDGSVQVTIDTSQYKEYTLTVRIDGPVTGTTPTLQFILFDQDGFGISVTGNQTASGVYTTNILSTAFTHYTQTGKMQLNWFLTGTAPSFGGVNAEITGIKDAIFIGQKTMAESMPVVIASDQSPITVTGTITTSPNVNIHDGAGNSLTSQVNGAQRALDVGIDVAGVQVDPRAIRALTSADIVRSSNLPATVDVNFGTVGASTLRTAAQIGNATGAALFGAGTTTAQVLRVVLPTDQSSIPVTQSTSPWVVSGTVAATQSGTWTTGRTWTLASGTDSVAAVQSGTWTVQQGTPPWSVVGAAASGAAKSGNPVQSGAVFNTTQPTVTTGQVVENQATARGALIVATGVDAFNINNITGTVSLPTGASTSALQTTGNTSLATIATNTASLILAQGSTTSGQTGNLIMGAVTTASPAYTTGQTSPLSLDTTGALRVTNSGSAADKTTFTYGTSNFTNVGGVFQDTSPALTAGQSGAVRLTANRAEHVNLRDASGNELLGQKTMANSVPVVLASDQSAVSIRPASSNITTYSASTTGLATALLATDIFTITGSGSQTIKIKKIRITGTRTSSTNSEILLIKRSTANSGGTSTTETGVSHDSTNAAATATVRSYTANPTLGTAVGTVRTQKQFINVLATGPSDIINWDFGQDTSQPIVLIGTSQVLAVNLNGATITGPSFDIYVEWVEG